MRRPAIADGWSRVRPHDVVERCPVADGGEGTMATLLGALGGEEVAATVPAPGRSVEASFGVVDAEAERLAIVESASASGLGLLPESGRDALRAGTGGTWRAPLLAALDRDLTGSSCASGAPPPPTEERPRPRPCGALPPRGRLADRTRGLGLLELVAVDLARLTGV
ncbi:MAG: glycerate kinase [Actinomycetota bacterium]